MHNRLVDEGYKPELSAAVNITSATTGMIIPPSNILIVYSLASGSFGVAALFVAGYLPGALVGLVLMSVASILTTIAEKEKHKGSLVGVCILRFFMVLVFARALYG